MPLQSVPEAHSAQLNVLHRPQTLTFLGLESRPRMGALDGGSPENLVGGGEVSSIRPLGVQERVVVILDQDLQLLDQPGIEVAEPGEARAPPLGDALVVAVPKLPHEGVAHAGTSAPGPERGDDLPVCGLGAVGAAAAVPERQAAVVKGGLSAPAKALAVEFNAGRVAVQPRRDLNQEVLCFLPCLQRHTNAGMTKGGLIKQQNGGVQHAPRN